MSSDMLKAFLCAELGELWDAERVMLCVLPQVVAQVKDAQLGRIIRARMPLVQLHSEHVQRLLAGYSAEEERSCARIRRLASDYGRMCSGTTNIDEAAALQLLRMDDYSIAAGTFAFRCSRAVGDLTTAMTLDGMIGEKQGSRESLAESAIGSRAISQLIVATRKRTFPRNHPFRPIIDDGVDRAHSVANDSRHSPHTLRTAEIAL